MKVNYSKILAQKLDFAEQEKLPLISPTCEMFQDNTQDPVESQQQLERVKDWINSRHLDTLELTDVLANFPDISIVMCFSSSYLPQEM